MKTKKTLSLILAVLMLVGLFMPVSAQAATSGKCGKNAKWAYKSGTLTISGTGAMYDYVMDYSAENFLSYPWFAYREKITKIVIEEGITYIGNNAFAYIGGYDPETYQTILFSVSIPSTVTKIGEDAFMWGSLDKIDIPDTVTEIGRGAYDTCQFATSIKISKNLKVIPEYAFCQCAKLTSLTIPSGVTTLERYAFSNCEGLKTITIPASVKTVGEGAFYSEIGNEPTWVCYKGGKAAWNKIVAVEYNKMLQNAKTVYWKPYFSTQPEDVTVKAGSTATFTVKAKGAGVKYQWQYMKPGSDTWTNVSTNGTSATYSLTAQTRHNGYVYRCKVTNKAGTTYSNSALLTTAKPSVTSYTKSVTVYAGKTATFKVEAVNAVTYQWQYKKPGATSWTSVSTNGTAATYKLTAKAKHDGYIYRCKLTNSMGTTYTEKIKLTVY